MQDDIQEKLDHNLKSKYESEVKELLENLEDENVAKAVDEIFDSTNDIDEIKEKVTLLIGGHLKSKNKEYYKDKDRAKDEDKNIAKDIDEFCSGINIEDLEEELSPGTIKKKDRDRLLSIEAKKNLKKILKTFAVYEIYKVMNPRRIAGETRKDNYLHNLIMGGEKLARKHTGGKDADLRKYGANEVKRMQKQAAAFRKNGTSIER